MLILNHKIYIGPAPFFFLALFFVYNKNNHWLKEKKKKKKHLDKTDFIKLKNCKKFINGEKRKKNKYFITMQKIYKEKIYFS